MSFVLNLLRANKLKNSTFLHEDWRLIALVGIFCACVLLRFTLIVNWPDARWFLAVAALAAVLIKIFASKRTELITVFVCFVALFISSFRAETIPQNIIKRETFTEITGKVLAAEYRENKPIRLTLRVNDATKSSSIAGKKVQIYVRTAIPKTLLAGDSVRLNVIFDKMNGPIVPDGFDYARFNLLKDIVAQGFATSAVVKVAEGNSTQHLYTIQQNLRDRIANEILNNMNPEYSGIAISLITGQRQFLDNDTKIALRDTGLSHLLAISGLHMGLLTAAAFFLFELIFASIPAVALRLLPRKLAGIAAWLFACIYLVISGGSTATLRAFIMVSIAIIAVLTDRRVISLRSVALAALAILVIDPAAILNVSFHMSFAATTALVIVYEFWDHRKRRKARLNKENTKPKIIKKILFYIAATASTTLIAQIAVAPFALYHFQTLSLTGLLTNIVAIPLMAFLVMPSAFIALMCILVGIEPVTLSIMEQGLRIILASVDVMQSIPNGVYYSMPYTAFVLPFMGLTIIISSILSRTLGILLWSTSAVCATLFFKTSPADILIDNGGRIIAQYIPSTLTMAIVGGRREGFRDSAWKQYWGINSETSPQKLDERCDTRACGIKLIKYGKLTNVPAIIRSKTLDETRLACSSNQIVIASYRHRRYCRGAYLFLSSEDIEQYGPVGLWFEQVNSSEKHGSAITIRWSIQPPKR